MGTNTAETKREMTTDEIAIFINIKDAEQNSINKLFEELSKQAGGWVLKVIEKRFDVYDVKTDKKTMIMVLTMGNGIVGKCAKYVDDMIHWCKEKGIKEIDFKLFYERIYPFGFPSF